MLSWISAAGTRPYPPGMNWLNGLGWDAGGSHLRKRLSELAAMEIVDYPARGQVALQQWVR
jgi:hypothetical protein